MSGGIISYGDDRLDRLGVKIKKVSGIYDFPNLKNTGINWSDNKFIDPLDRLIDYQYNTRKIILDCILVCDSFDVLERSLGDLITFLTIYDGLRMLVVQDYSYRGFMCRLCNSTSFKPDFSQSGNKKVAEFRLVFEEPQPFNAQFSMKVINNDDLSLSLNISKTSKTASIDSTRQQYITVDFIYFKESINLEQETYSRVINYNLEEGRVYPLIITGEIDSIDDFHLDISYTGAELYGLDTLNYYLRNVDIT